MLRGAMISDCGKYRYALSRIWDQSLQSVAFVMLNPSTADEEQDDPTIRRCMGFARTWGLGGIRIYNLFALRATDPSKLKTTFDPIGPENDLMLRMLATESIRSVRVIAAWGAHGRLWDRGRKVMAMFIPGTLEALDVNRDGSPKHPLYVAGNTIPVPFGVGLTDTGKAVS